MKPFNKIIQKKLSTWKDIILKKVEKDGKNFGMKKMFFSSKIDKNKKKFYCLEMFPYPSGKFIWDMLEIIQLVMFYQDTKY